MSPSPPIPSQTIIAERYELQRRLAQGGMAEVWLAVDLTLDRKVAVKWLKSNLATDELVAERFRREAIAAASLNHPNIVAVHDVFEHEGRQAVVMQLVDGKSLRQLLDTQKRLSPELTTHIGVCTAAALDHAHENNFVHRDVKPGNIMITPDGRVLLTDFGIAKALAGGDDLTNDNIMMGTAKYLSPEQVRGKKLDGRADLYSLGLVLYECLAGRVPFLGETDADTALARLQRDPTDLTRLRPTVPTAMVDIIHQLLTRNPSSRPATGRELITALEAALKEGPPTIDDTPYEPSSRTPPTGRLRRAPSDSDRRAPSDSERRVPSDAERRERRDRQRSTPRPKRPLLSELRHDPDPPHRDRATGAGGVGSIPGEPITTGPVPVTAAPATTTGRIPITTPSRRPDPTPPRRRDDTPAAGADLRGKPARGMLQERRPSMTVVAVLLLLASVVAAVLFVSIEFGGGASTAPTTVLPPGATEPPPDDDATDPNIDPAGDPTSDPTGVDADGADGSTETAGGAPLTGPATILTISAYDPDGDFTENDADAPLALAGTGGAWRTVCYGSQFMGGKQGVGLVVTLERPAVTAIGVEVVNGPYQLEFRTSTSESIPTSFDAWDGQLGAKQFAASGERVESPTSAAPVRHVLLLLSEIGADSECSSNNPYRGALADVSLLTP